CLQALQTPF
nr:immunoglobulin light chain junction region [Macaca mulatta]MOX50372.1 immunoglobulin light chain junction region [Macaca mulatta]